MTFAERIERDSQTWRAVKEWAEAEIAAAQKRLESPYLGPVETEHERGSIKALRRLVSLPEPGANIPPQSGGYAT